jgi:hypothetical protein
MYEQTKSHIDEWRHHLRGQVAFSASDVQDRLFDLYGDLDGTPSLEHVKPWLLLTRQRELFSAEELGEFLIELELAIDMASMEEPTPA